VRKAKPHVGKGGRKVDVRRNLRGKNSTGQCPLGLRKVQTVGSDLTRSWAEALGLTERVVSALETASKDLSIFRASRTARFTRFKAQARHSRRGNHRPESRMRENRTYGSEGGEA